MRSRVLRRSSASTFIAGDPHKLGQLLNWFVLLATAGGALAARTRALSAAPVAAPLGARVLLLLTGRPSRRRDVPPRAAVDAPLRRRRAARDAHARPPRVRLAARSRDGCRSRAGPAGARVFALDNGGRRARIRGRTRLEAAARDPRRDGGGDCTLVRTPGARVRESALRPADEERSDLGPAAASASTSASGCPTSSRIRFARTSVNEAMPTTYSDVWGDYFGVFGWDAVDLAREARTDAVSASCPRCSRSQGGLPFSARSPSRAGASPGGPAPRAGHHRLPLLHR